MSAGEYEGSERRREDRELASWRGGMEARLTSVERDLRDLVASAKMIDRTVTRMEGRIEALRDDVNENRAETRGLSSSIDTARDDVVKELKTADATRASTQEAWHLTRFQVWVGGILALVAPTVSTLIVLGITGQLQ